VIQSGTAIDFLRVVRFPLPIIAPQSSLYIIQCWYSSPINGLSTSGLCPPPAQHMNLKNNPRFLYYGMEILEILSRKLARAVGKRGCDRLTRHLSFSDLMFLVTVLSRRAAGFLDSAYISLHDQNSYHQSTTRKQTGLTYTLCRDL
jgi:hypothetical protein